MSRVIRRDRRSWVDVVLYLVFMENLEQSFLVL